MTFDAKTKTTRIFLNGTETINATTITYEPWQLTTIAADTRNYIGRTQWWDTSVAASNIDYNGTLDDVCLYDIALTVAEIAQVQSNVTTVLDLKEKTNLSIFPNPAKRNSTIEINYNLVGSDLKSINVEVVNTLGERVQLLHPSSTTANISGLTQSGIYLVRVMSGNEMISTSKLVVQ